MTIHAAMKYFLFVVTLLFLAIDSYSQHFGTEKIEPKYFQNLTRFDTCAIVVVSDDSKLNFIYRDLYVGAVDRSFRAELTRQIRIKVNRINSLHIDQLTIAKLADSISIDELEITDLTIYHYKNEKILKNKVKAKSLGLSLVNGVILLDLNKIEVGDGALVNLSYKINDVLKKTQRWNFHAPYYLATSSLEVHVPEIYVYHQKVVNPNNLKVDYVTKKSSSILIGYYVPHVTSGQKLISPTYYKVMKDRDADVNKASKVYCGYTLHRFDVKNVFPIATVGGEAYIDFKLVTVNPIY